MAKDDKPGSGQTNPRATAGNPPAPPASTGPDEFEIPKLGETSTPVDTGSTLRAAAQDSTPDQSPPASGLSAADKQEVATIAAEAAAGVMERFFARMDARDRPVMGRDTYDAEVLARVSDVDITTSGNVDDIKRSDLDIARADPVAFESHAAELAFMQEPVTVVVHESTDPNEQAIIGPIGINGRQIYLERGKETTIPRCYVEQLFRARTHRKKTKVVRNDDGDVFNRISTSSALAYPFAITRDVNPRGRAWRNKLAREG